MESHGSTWEASTSGEVFETISESQHLCRDCIEIKPLAVLGERDGPGFLLESQDVLLDRAGRFWVAHAGSLKVFDSRGVFIREVGRPGQGPGEFQYPRPLFVDTAGGIHVFDPGNARETIFGLDFSKRAEHPLVLPIESVVPIDGGRRYVQNAWIPSLSTLGSPLHVVESGDIQFSFGAEREYATGELNSFTNRRLLAVDAQGRIYSVKQHHYEIEVWTPEGDRVAGFRLPQINERPVLPGPISAENPYPTTIRGIHVDSGGLVWILMWRPRPDWQDYMEERQRPDGNVVLTRREAVTTGDLWTGRLDVIDLRAASIVARVEAPTIFARFLSEGVAWAPAFLGDGSPVVTVWSLRMSRP